MYEERGTETAEIQKQTAAITANKVRVLGEAKAKALQQVEGEKANGLQLKTAVFDDPVAYARWRFAETLNPELRLNISIRKIKRQWEHQAVIIALALN